MCSSPRWVVSLSVAGFVVIATGACASGGEPARQVYDSSLVGAAKVELPKPGTRWRGVHHWVTMPTVARYETCEGVADHVAGRLAAEGSLSDSLWRAPMAFIGRATHFEPDIARDAELVRVSGRDPASHGEELYVEVVNVEPVEVLWGAPDALERLAVASMLPPGANLPCRIGVEKIPMLILEPPSPSPFEVALAANRGVRVGVHDSSATCFEAAAELEQVARWADAMRDASAPDRARELEDALVRGEGIPAWVAAERLAAAGPDGAAGARRSFLAAAHQRRLLAGLIALSQRALEPTERDELCDGLGADELRWLECSRNEATAGTTACSAPGRPYRYRSLPLEP